MPIKKKYTITAPGWSDELDADGYCENCIYFWDIVNIHTDSVRSICNNLYVNEAICKRPNVANLFIDYKLISICQLLHTKATNVSSDILASCVHTKFYTIPKILLYKDHLGNTK